MVEEDRARRRVAAVAVDPAPDRTAPAPVAPHRTRPGLAGPLGAAAPGARPRRAGRLQRGDAGPGGDPERAELDGTAGGRPHVRADLRAAPPDQPAEWSRPGLRHAAGRHGPAAGPA